MFPKIRFDTCHCGTYALGIVSAIVNNDGVPRKQFKTRRPTHALESFANGCVVNLKALLFEQFNCSQHKGRIIGLICAKQGQVHIGVVQIIKGCPLKRCILLQIRRTVNGTKRCVFFKGNLLYGIVCRTARAAKQNRSVRFDNACLLIGNLLYGVTKERGMVKIDTRNNRKRGVFNDVCRIQTSAKSNLQNHHVARTSFKIRKCQSGDEFKLGRLVLHCIGNGTNALGQCGKLFFGNVFTVNANAFAKRANVRRGIKSCTVTCALQNRGKHTGGRTLAVGTCHVNETEFVLRISKSLAKRSDAFKTGLAKGPVNRVDIFECLFVIHGIILRESQNGGAELGF